MMIKVVVLSSPTLLKMGKPGFGVGCVAEDDDGCEAWLIRNGYAEGVGGSWSKVGGSTGGVRIIIEAKIISKPLIAAGGVLPAGQGGW